MIMRAYFVDSMWWLKFMMETPYSTVLHDGAWHLNERQTITWITDKPVHRRIYVSQDLNNKRKLIMYITFCQHMPTALTTTNSVVFK